jgi:archaemetzincin
MRNLLIPLFFFIAASCSNNKTADTHTTPGKKKFSNIAFLLYDNFDTVILNTAIKEATAFYHCKATVLSPRPLPAFAFYEPRQRYKADSLLKFQRDLLPAGCQSIVGLTQKDISTGDPDWGIFGLGYNPGNACVISVFRLSSTSYDHYQERFIKVLLHELGHNQGLPHCTYNEYCIMNDAKGTIAQVDKEKKWLCDHCKEMLANQVH